MAGNGEVIGMMGMGKLGLPVALAIESRGHEVMGYDIDWHPYKYMQDRQIPYKEEGIEPLLEKSYIQMTRILPRLIEKSDIIFLPVQTPHAPEYEGTTKLPEERADFDYSFLKQAVGDVAMHAARLEKPTTLAVISTCLPGTFEREIRPLLNEYVDYVYTPQFIAMGTVLQDYLDPEFALIGVDSERAANKLEKFYDTLFEKPHLVTDITTAEGIKVAYNTFITMKTVLGNTWGELSHKLGMNVDDIYKAWTLSDKRLMSPKYLKAGVGDGGGCHPRDNIALSYLAEQHNLSHNLFEDLMKSREDHMAWLGDLAADVSNVTGMPIVVLGRSFKPETNIETGSPALLMANLIKKRHQKEVSHVEDTKIANACVFVIGTQHERYKDLDFPEGSVVIDPFGYIPDKKGVDVVRIGRP